MKTSPFLDEIRKEGREEGRAEEARMLVGRMARKKFGKAPAKRHQLALDAITDLTCLEALAERLVHVDSWGELLGDG